MKILIPVACLSPYTTAIYVERAFRRMGHEAQIITQAEFYADHPDVDLFFGVDSAGGLDFPEKHFPRVAMWFIDSRRNCTLRSPGDDEVAKKIADAGGWVFQAQKRDWTRCLYAHDVVRGSWLPLGADVDIWKPYDLAQEFDVGFCGNIWDEERRQMLDSIKQSGLTLNHIVEMPEVAASELSRCRTGFNISSFFGSDIAFDVNMRVFEVLSCGLPLVTNALPELQEVGLLHGHNCYTYHTQAEALLHLHTLVGAPKMQKEIGDRGRKLILDGHTYLHRMQEACSVLSEAGVLS